MTILKTFGYICVTISSWLIFTPTFAQQPLSPTPRSTQSVQPQKVKGIQYVAIRTSTDSIPFFSGFSIGVDVVAPIRAAVSSQGGYEGVLRANLQHRWFPLVELGYGVCDHKDYSSALHFKTAAPYLRIGCDYNFNKDFLSGNRILGGLRVAGSSFQYDLSGEPIQDLVWGGQTDYRFSKISSSAIWAELIFSLEAKIWKNFHLGWSVRYKRRLYHQQTIAGSPWHIPGYGKNDGHTFGATFHLTLDI